MSNTSNDDVDGECTAELPILIESSVIDAADVPPNSAARGDDVDDTGEHTANYLALVPPDENASAEITTLRKELEAQKATLAIAASDVADLNSRLSTAATQIFTKDSEIAALKRIVHDVGTALAEHQAAAQEARTALAERNVEHARLIAELAALQGALAALKADSDKYAAAHPSADASNEDLRRIVDLERELAASTTALRSAEALAASEVKRAKAIRAELVIKAREVETLHRTLAARRAAEAEPRPATPAPAVFAPSDERVVALEKAVADRDLAITAQDASITALQEQLQLQPPHPAPQPTDSGIATKTEQPTTTATDSAQLPALIRLTGDTPERFELAHPETLLGRGPNCDVQILTEVTSREHARISMLQAGAFIEDLGSTNGVFVNSVRVTRQPLHEGDLITLGETQFRFVATMAH